MKKVKKKKKVIIKISAMSMWRGNHGMKKQMGNIEEYHFFIIMIQKKLLPDVEQMFQEFLISMEQVDDKILQNNFLHKDRKLRTF